MTATEPGQPYPLARAFVASLTSADGAGAEWDARLAELDEGIQRAWSAGQEEWPDLDLAPARFAAHLGLAASGTPDPIASLHELATSDLFLACAALAGNRRALSQFESHTFGEIDAAAASLRAPDSDLEEVKQIVRTQLFVAEGPRAPVVADYAGRGSLRGWVRVIATRELLRMRRKARKEIPLEEHILHDLGTQADPEIDRLKQLYHAQVASALREAIDRLEVRERLLLRYQICDHLSIDAIGAIYQVHRATAARWLSKAREALVDLMKERLAILLSVDPGDTDSILRLVQSQLDVSLERRLRDEP